MFGQTNVPGIYSHEVYKVTDDIGTLLMKGVITASLSAADGNSICTRDGKEIDVWGRVDAHQRESEVRAVDRAVAAAAEMLDGFATALMKGSVFAPVLASNGQTICDSGGQAIIARYVRTEHPSIDMSSATQGMATSLVAMMEAYHRTSLTRIDALERGIMSGQLTTHLLGHGGAGINTRSGAGIDASIYIN